jgi:DNA (cytosine-5)-methyltransferase 1
MFKVADLCGGAGISGDGYTGAGCLTTGFDNDPKCAAYYPGEFHCVDILSLTVSDLKDYDLIHLGAPCQRWSPMCACRPELAAQYPDLITPMRPVLDELAEEHGIPYVVENVEQCSVLRPERSIMLCGAMWGKDLYRHRRIETGGGLVVPPLLHPKHTKRASRAGHWEPGTVMSIAGHVAPIAMAFELMGVTRKMPRERLVEAAPAFYMAYVAEHARGFLSSQRAA